MAKTEKAGKNSAEKKYGEKDLQIINADKLSIFELEPVVNPPTPYPTCPNG